MEKIFTEAKSIMNHHHKRRIILISIAAFCIAMAVSLILFALKQNINVFLTPSEVKTIAKQSHYRFRLGGLVKKNSIKRDKEGLGIHFTVTDLKNDIDVYYIGTLPDLFRENKGMIAEGTFNPNGVFEASQVLAKHDENYMPKNISNQLNENQHA